MIKIWSLKCQKGGLKMSSKKAKKLLESDARRICPKRAGLQKKSQKMAKNHDNFFVAKSLKNQKRPKNGQK